jgi:hypothetical protein
MQMIILSNLASRLDRHRLVRVHEVYEVQHPVVNLARLKRVDDMDHCPLTGMVTAAATQMYSWQRKRLWVGSKSFTMSVPNVTQREEAMAVEAGLDVKSPAVASHPVLDACLMIPGLIAPHPSSRANNLPLGVVHARNVFGCVI